MDNIKGNLDKILLDAEITLKEKVLKLQITTPKAQIKLEVNQINRGILDELVELPLCDKAQEEYDAFCSIFVVSMGQLYGGKVCAALDL
ncbi:hypothetical protein [Flavivirga spongiicola]|uniref:Uncharacterized protein n=1 Tax=Flavivirga spongiicola TaxID=421621 RepID=A0ABU7XZ10_9FLAO|nr:hypothetical protein [Flavivirga sp. MEBiC05379]MDO5980807.1 hypothetical protein [Flavivirga sp. MEBiC05379]